MEADFSGWATKNDLKCSDGRTIKADAFKHQDKMTVPLVWAHQHDGPENVLGHAVLENRAFGVYTYGFFNETENGKTAKDLVKHGDINSLSIYANKLVQKGADVIHGDIKEVSLVMAGANPGAFIDNVNLLHGDGLEVDETEAVIYTGITGFSDEEPVEHADTKEKTPVAPTQDKTVPEIVDSMTEEQKNAMYFLIGQALDEAGTAKHSGMSDEDFIAHVETTINTKLEEGLTNMHNIFEGKDKKVVDERATLSHDQLKTIIDDGPKFGSLRESFLAHAGDYGIDDIELLFPDARTDGNGIAFISRRTEWVNNVLTQTKHSPFSRIKSLAADITADEARARGYVKGNLKKDEVIKLLKRVTTPKTVYKKQKLDRDDIVDITEVDIITWLKAEMRLMLDEEIAVAVLVGDGREPDDDDKIDEDHIRPIAFDVDMYNTRIELTDANPAPAVIIEQILRARKSYKGTGTPTFYTTDDVLTDLILDKDTLGRRFYSTEEELAAALRVKEIVTVEAMERVTDVVGILVNLVDYTIGADRGGEINTFDDFDIDYNQQKYLIETRISGALTKPKSAVTIIRNQGTVVTPNAPTFVSSTGIVTIPAQTGVIYKNDDTGATLTAGAQNAIAAGSTLNVQAVPDTGYSFPHNGDFDWGFTRPNAGA